MSLRGKSWAEKESGPIRLKPVMIKDELEKWWAGALDKNGLTCSEAFNDASVNDLSAALAELRPLAELPVVVVLITESFPFPNDNDWEMESAPLETESMVLFGETRRKIC